MSDTKLDVFISRDKIRSEMLKNMENSLELTNLSLENQDYMAYILNILSIQTSNLLFYNSSVYNEFFLTKAIQKESVDNIVSSLGYTPDLASPSQAKVLVTIDVNFGSNTTITLNGAKNIYDDPSPYLFYAGEDIAFSPINKTVIDFIISGGSLTSSSILEYTDTGGVRTIPYIINGSKVSFYLNIIQVNSYNFTNIVPILKPYSFYTYDIDIEEQINNIYITSSIPGNSETILWEYYSSLYMIPPGVRGFTYRILENKVRFIFGNSVIGFSPEQGSTLKFLINTTLGTGGNVIAGSINKSRKISINDTIDGKPIIRQVQVDTVNLEPAYGGKDFPTIDELRTNTIKNISSDKRIITEADFSNISSIVSNLPVKNAIQVLKRSDLKQNEIALFTDMVYGDSVIPMRNGSTTLDTTTGFTLKANTTIVDSDAIEYTNIFNINIDAVTGDSNYYYLISSIEKNPEIIKNYKLNPTDASIETIIQPTKVTFTYVQGSPDIITANIDFIKIDPLLNASAYNCIMKTDWNSKPFNYTTYLYSDLTKTYQFQFQINLSEIPSGEQTFKFDFYTNTSSLLIETKVDIIITKSLKHFMKSDIDLVFDSSSGLVTTAHVYDIPMIKKSFYDLIDKQSFTQEIMEKIIQFNPGSYKMISEFINIKFSNTTGKMTNMLFNKTTKSSVINLNPATIPGSPVIGDRYAVSTDINPWNVPPHNKTSGGFIAEYATGATWKFSSISVNDIFTVTALGSKYIYTGTSFAIPVQTIPLTVDIVVWKDKTLSYSDSALSESIKESIINNLYGGFGYNKTLYISSIYDSVMKVSGVSGCSIKSPKHDIFFNFDILEDLTQLEISTYSPELVFIDTAEIKIEVR